MNNYNNSIVAFIFCSFFFSFDAFAADVATDQARSSSIEQEVNQLRGEAADLERDIGLLEKDLLFPPLTRVEVFLSVQPDLDFQLRSVVFSLDGDEKSFHVYTMSDITALQMGGLQQFWEGNVALGQHELLVEFVGLNVKGATVKKQITHKFEKTRSGLAFEIQVKSGANATTPKFSVKAWNNR